MKKLSRLVLVAALVGLGTAGTPAQANHECGGQPCYDCVAYPCYPSDWVEYLSGGNVTIDDDHRVCVGRVTCV